MNDGFDYSLYIDEQLVINLDRDPSYRRYKAPLFPEFTDATGGFNTGLYVVVADPNLGKSCFLQTLCYDLLLTNPHVRVLFYTLDDNCEEMTKRFIATATYHLAGLDHAVQINNAFYGRINNAAERMTAVKNIQGFKRFNRLYMKDLLKISTTTEIIADIRDQIAVNPADTIVFIDSALTLDAKGSGVEMDKNRAIDLKKIVALTNAPVILTAEKKKDDQETGVKRVDMREISGHAKMAFVANFVVSFSYADKEKFFNKEGENWRDTNAYISKNKVGSTRGTVTCVSYGEYATLIEKPMEDYF